MKMFRSTLAVLIFLIAGNFGFGQEMKAEKYENPEWVSISYIKFKPMKKDAAMGIIENYFAKVRTIHVDPHYYAIAVPTNSELRKTFNQALIEVIKSPAWQKELDRFIPDAN